MKVRITLTLALLISAALAWSAPASKEKQEKQEKPLRIFIRASEKTHGPGQHDYPGFLLEWTALLAQRGAAATGALRFPSRAELDQTDVLVLYAADGGNMSATQARDLERFIRRGGGVVALHDAICGTNALQLKTLIGGAKQHGATNWSRGLMGLYVQDSAHPITQGVSNFDLEDELFFDLKLEPGQGSTGPVNGSRLFGFSEFVDRQPANQLVRNICALQRP